jgi:hypothetical protein
LEGLSCFLCYNHCFRVPFLLTFWSSNTSLIISLYQIISMTGTSMVSVFLTEF